MSCRLSKTKPDNNATTVSKFKAKVPNYSVGGEEQNFTQQPVLCWMLANWPMAPPPWLGNTAGHREEGSLGFGLVPQPHWATVNESSLDTQGISLGSGGAVLQVLLLIHGGFLRMPTSPFSLQRETDFQFFSDCKGKAYRSKGFIH